MARTYRALGLMSGTAHDAIDAAIIETDGEVVTHLGASASLSFAPDFRRQLSAAVHDARIADYRTAQDHAYRGLESALTQQHAELVAALLEDTGLDHRAIDLIGFHGQTILHRPAERFTWQLGDAAQLATLTGIPVVGAFRKADVAVGGQGAPFAPAYHRALLAGGVIKGPVAILNLGGVGNVTFIGSDGGLMAFDTGPGNALLDDWVQRHQLGTFDKDGALAAKGAVDKKIIARCLNLSYFSKRPPKSLDRNEFGTLRLGHLSIEDGAATLTALTAATVATALQWLPERPNKWFVTGGGRHNPIMMARLQEYLDCPVDPVEMLGWRGDSLEAEAFAYLAVRSVLGLPLSYPGTTGVVAPLTGGELAQPDQKPLI